MKKDSFRNHLAPTKKNEVEEANERLRARRLNKKWRASKNRSTDESDYDHARATDTTGDAQNDETQPQPDTRMATNNESPTKN